MLKSPEYAEIKRLTNGNIPDFSFFLTKRKSASDNSSDMFKRIFGFEEIIVNDAWIANKLKTNKLEDDSNLILKISSDSLNKLYQHNLTLYRYMTLQILMSRISCMFFLILLLRTLILVTQYFFKMKDLP